MKNLFESVLSYTESVVYDAISMADRGESNPDDSSLIYNKINPYLEQLRKLISHSYEILSTKDHPVKNRISVEDILTHSFELNDSLILSGKVASRTALVDFFKEDVDWMFLIGISIHGSGFYEIKPSGLFVRLKDTIYKHYGR